MWGCEDPRPGQPRASTSGHVVGHQARAQSPLKSPSGVFVELVFWCCMRCSGIWLGTRALGRGVSWFSLT